MNCWKLTARIIYIVCGRLALSGNSDWWQLSASISLIPLRVVKQFTHPIHIIGAVQSCVVSLPSLQTLSCCSHWGGSQFCGVLCSLLLFACRRMCNIAREDIPCSTCLFLCSVEQILSSLHSIPKSALYGTFSSLPHAEFLFRKFFWEFLVGSRVLVSQLVCVLSWCWCWHFECFVLCCCLVEELVLWEHTGNQPSTSVRYVAKMASHVQTNGVWNSPAGCVSASERSVYPQNLCCIFSQFGLSNLNWSHSSHITKF